MRDGRLRAPVRNVLPLFAALWRTEAAGPIPARLRRESGGNVCCFVRVL